MRGREHFWVSWANHGGALSRAGRGNVSPEVWAKMRVGDSVEVSRVPGDDAAHLRNGVFVEPGNFVFDFVLLALTLGVAVASAGRLLLWWYYPGKKEAHERRRPWQPEAPARDRRHPSLALRAAKEAPSFGDQLPCRWNTEGGKRDLLGGIAQGLVKGFRSLWRWAFSPRRRDAVWEILCRFAIAGRHLRAGTAVSITNRKLSEGQV